MNPKKVSIWYDRKGDFLEVVWEDKKGEFVDSADGNAYVKIDDEGNILGFQVLGMSRIDRFLALHLDQLDRDDNSTRLKGEV